MIKSLPAVFGLSLVMVACGPAGRSNTGGDDDGSNTDVDAAPVVECTPQSEAVSCTDGRDNDCDTRVDCGDPDCSGVGDCPVCGTVENPEATPLALPDGVSDGSICAIDYVDGMQGPNECPMALPNCIIAGSATEPIKECHTSYSAPLDFIGFPIGATLTDSSKLLNVCVTMEHSYLHDLHMELIAPPNASGARQKMALYKFLGRIGPEIYLGMANDDDTPELPVAGVGYKYCWTAAAPTEMNDGYTSVGGTNVCPAGDYKPVTPFSAMQGAPLNGTWELRVTDLFAQDNGFMFEWSISFDPSLVEDCAGPIIQ